MAGPERTCVACRARSGKNELLRLARGADGSVQVDPTGRTPGRGAYVHRNPACAAEVGRRGAVARALRVRLGPEETTRLVDDVRRTVEKR